MGGPSQDLISFSGLASSRDWASTGFQVPRGGQLKSRPFLSVPPLVEETRVVSDVSRLFEIGAGLQDRTETVYKRVDHSTQSVPARSCRGELRQSEGAG